MWFHSVGKFPFFVKIGLRLSAWICHYSSFLEWKPSNDSLEMNWKRRLIKWRSLHKKLKRGKISLDCRFLLKVFVQRLLSFILVVTKQDKRSSPVLLCRWYVISDKSEQFQPLFDLGGSFISCNTHSAESCSKFRSMFKFQVGHLHLKYAQLFKSPTKISKDWKILIFHFHCWKSNDSLLKCFSLYW